MEEHMQEPQKSQVSEGPTDTQKKKRSRWKNVLLIIVEVSVLLLAVGVLYVVTRTTEEVERREIDEEKIIINEEVEQRIEEKEEGCRLPCRQSGRGICGQYEKMRMSIWHLERKRRYL